jgi:hypothetical protein
LKRDKRIKESTIYKKAWDITNGNYQNKPKRTKVHESNTKLGSISLSKRRCRDFLPLSSTLA